jgi:hypothetical protein
MFFGCCPFLRPSEGAELSGRRPHAIHIRRARLRSAYGGLFRGERPRLGPGGFVGPCPVAYIPVIARMQKSVRLLELLSCAATPALRIRRRKACATTCHSAANARSLEPLVAKRNPLRKVPREYQRHLPPGTCRTICRSAVNADGRAQAYRRREEPRAQSAASRHQTTLDATVLAFIRCYGLFGSAHGSRRNRSWAKSSSAIRAGPSM